MWSSNAAVSDEILLDTMNTTAVYATFSCYSFIFPAEKEVSLDVHWIEHGDIAYMDALNLGGYRLGVPGSIGTRGGESDSMIAIS
jgi:hypothetical protein